MPGRGRPLRDDPPEQRGSRWSQRSITPTTVACASREPQYLPSCFARTGDLPGRARSGVLLLQSGIAGEESRPARAVALWNACNGRPPGAQGTEIAAGRPSLSGGSRASRSPAGSRAVDCRQPARLTLPFVTRTGDDAGTYRMLRTAGIGQLEPRDRTTIALPLSREAAPFAAREPRWCSGLQATAQDPTMHGRETVAFARRSRRPNRLRPDTPPLSRCGSPARRTSCFCSSGAKRSPLGEDSCLSGWF